MEPSPSLPTGGQLEQLASFELMLLADNERLGLVSPTALSRFKQDMLAPCLKMASLPMLNAEPLSVVDLGSGGGLPGIPLAIMLPAHRYLLIDRYLKKCQFLTRVTESLQLNHVDVLHARIEKVRDRPAPDLFVARFVKDPRMLAAWTRRWRRPGVRYLLMGGAEAPTPARIYDLELQASHPLAAEKVAHEYLAK
ncbi:MAG: class I SAM-dependent methyltransferase [bacterium]|nr:class I SAM-dependent methyltransferase [bacterium]